MATSALTAIVPHLWYVKEAEQAARFYTKIFPKSRIDRTWKIEPGAGAGAGTSCVEFRLFGQPFFAMSAGEHDPFNDAVSFGVRCRTQAEVDRYWNAILKNGGKAIACGWIRDKFGVRWQIVPVALLEMMADRDKKKAVRVAIEMQKQVKFDIALVEWVAERRLRRRK
jgi:predicted 3-demethylubiquinone-9 3-methyltransferase (glyoxalase superfamily)